MKILIVILARKGSKRLKNKNLRKIGKHSLVLKTIKFAKKIRFIKDIILSSDSKKIISIAKEHCIAIKRPAYLSRSSSTSASAAIHAIRNYENNFSKIDSILLLQPTTPFRKLKDIYKAIKLNNKYKNGVMSVTSYNLTKKSDKTLYIISKNKLKKIKNKNLNNAYAANGSIYLTNKNYLLKYRDLQRNGSYPIIINTKKYFIDIDYIKDLNDAKKYV
jgi:CMP-N,N'-diacetyllegionaminic acid synthase